MVFNKLRKKEIKKYNQKPNIKLSKEFKTKLMKLKYEFGYKDIEELIKKMYEIVTKFKLANELKIK